VNLSARQFMDEDLIHDVKRALDESGLKPELLELELTEGMVMQNIERTTKVLAAVKEMGVRLAIDDFGLGYSSLATLKRFPFDTLKVDRSFIRNLAAEGDERAITEAIVAMGKTLSMTVVAAGVETKEERAYLRDLGCD
jgi:EAL domain-containing protein (putative c-di-GMP-specific phosphodiesterase class I)